MGILSRIKELINCEKTLQEKEKILKETENSIDQSLKKLDQIENEIKKATEKKEQIIIERDNEQQKTKEACEKVIKSYEEKGQAAKNNFEETQKQYLQIRQSVTQLNKTEDLLKEKLKLYKSYINKTLHSIKNNEIINDSILNDLAPTVELHLNAFDVKNLRDLIKENKRMTDALLIKYEQKYTTKSNKAIYQLMVLALRSELQNILIDLKYNTVDKCKNNLSEMINKFLNIASDGNQQIAPTIKTFIGEISILFEQLIDIEYTYFVRKEQEKAEQLALREQMRQETEERKALEQEQKKIEKEEVKYKSEISNAEKLLTSCEDEEKLKNLIARIEELKKLLAKVEDKKEEIINRQNGKAGYVYVISNLGSFGENRFKIGMTRRLEPMDRVRELGDASVPFSFDVHSFIFSEDAVNLESELHQRLNSKRTNKINLRKEFFDISIDELEKLVYEICPSAEFNKTMLAIEYKKGLEIEL